MAAETQYTANTGIGQATVANSNLDGTGTLATVLTAASNGTLVKSITIKAIGSTTQGMVRIFVNDTSNNRLIEEIPVPPITVSGTNPAFEYTWNCNLKLEASWILKASTETGDDFNVIAEGLDWTYFTGSVRPESTQYTANTGVTVISTANSNRDGTGTIGTVVTAGASATYKGCSIESVTIKAIQNTTIGTVRLYLYDTTNTRLISEIPIPAVICSATVPAFEQKITLGNFQLQAGWSLRASTENAESFAITAECNDWKYPPSTTIYNFTPASGTAVTTEELLHSLQVPAGLFTTGDIMRVYADLITTNSANNKTFRIYVNTSNTLTAATLLSTVVYTANAAESIMRLYPVISNTSLGCHGGTTQSVQTQYEANAGTTANTTVPSVAAGFWVLISGQKATAGETDTVQWSMVKKENS